MISLHLYGARIFLCQKKPSGCETVKLKEEAKSILFKETEQLKPHR